MCSAPNRERGYQATARRRSESESCDDHGFFRFFCDFYEFRKNGWVTLLWRKTPLCLVCDQSLGERFPKGERPCHLMRSVNMAQPRK